MVPEHHERADLSLDCRDTDLYDYSLETTTTAREQMRHSAKPLSHHGILFATLITAFCVSCDGPRSWGARTDVCVTVERDHSADASVRESEGNPVASGVIQTPPPPNAVMFFNGPCPVGWETYGDAQGRFIVGTPKKGTPGFAPEIKPVPDDKTPPKHQHSMPYTTTDVKKGDDFTIYTLNHFNSDKTRALTYNNDAKLPYIQLTACVASMNQISSHADLDPERGG